MIAKEYQCELQAVQFVSPKMGGFQFILQTNPPRFFCHYVFKQDGQIHRETGDYPDGSCWSSIKEREPNFDFEQLLEVLKRKSGNHPNFEGLFQLEPTSPAPFFFVFDTKSKPTIKKFGAKNNGIINWYPNKKLRGNFRFRKNVSGFTDALGKLNNGMKVKLKLHDNLSSKLTLSGSFGKII